MADDISTGNAQTTTSVFEPGPTAGTATSGQAQPTPGATGAVVQPSQTATDTFTQADLDRIVKERLSQERKKFADYDALKAKVTAQEEASKTESEKLAERLKTLEAQNQQLASERRELSIRAAITDAAAAVGLPADAAYRLIDKAQVTINEDGTIANATELVKAVSEAYPGLVRSNGAQTPRVAAANPARSAETVGRTDADRFRDYFTGGGRGFWGGGGVRQPNTQ